MEAKQGERHLLPALVRQLEHPLEQGPRRPDLAAPHQPLRSDPLRRHREMERSVRDAQEPVAEVVDRASAQAAGPAEALEREPLEDGVAVARRRRSLLGP